MPKADIRPTLPQAVKSRYVWTIDNDEYNFFCPSNKYGEVDGLTFNDRFMSRPYYKLATYGGGKLVGVFLLCSMTDPNSL